VLDQVSWRGKVVDETFVGERLEFDWKCGAVSLEKDP